MSEITLVSNSGIQFYNFKLNINPQDFNFDVFRFIEDVDVKRFDWWIDEVLKIENDSDSYYSRLQLQRSGIIDKYGQLNLAAFAQNRDVFTPYDEGNVNQIKNPLRTLDIFCDKWIPIPYFKKNNINPNFFGPVDWARVFISKADNQQYDVALVFDTTATKDEKDNLSPFISDNPNENKFELCEDDGLILSFLDNELGGSWVGEYLKKIVKRNEDMAQTIHLALYVHLIRILRRTSKLPTIQMVSDLSGAIDVDLVIDIGNSNTCVLLFENPNDEKFNFNKVKQLVLRDLSDPHKSNNSFFSTRLIFKDLEFGNSAVELSSNNKFQWPSVVRIGDEAQRLINGTAVEFSLNRESQFYHSSPKRYLWDLETSKMDWEFQPMEMNHPPKRVFKHGISEQITNKGELCENGIFGRGALYNRKSLMTFIYLEIFTQAICQINSVEFRTSHGNPGYRRRLRRVVVSCPTAMTKDEQFQLRKCAQDALQIMKNYNNVIHSDDSRVNPFIGEIDVIPSLRDLQLPDTENESKKDWIYDEATVSQLLYLYSQIQYKFDGNPELFFNLFGKTTKQNKKKLRVGSIDIGGGTSDFLVCEYSYRHDELTEITPEPLYWESFHLAGDDLLQQIIQQIVIEGTPRNASEIGCSGVIEQFGLTQGIDDIHNRLNGFFGKDSMNIGYRGKLMRVNFINQIGIPLAYEYMKIANRTDSEVREMTFTDLFHDRMPNQDLLRYFERHFGFKFQDIIWKMNPAKVNEVIESTFSKLVSQISQLMHVYKCDVVILSGKPCDFKSLENLFVRFSALQSNRIVNLNNYWIGRWYPFANNNGFISDPKTVICMGSLISLLGGKLFKLDRFRINDELLKKNLTSTAEYLGAINDFSISNSVLTPGQNENQFVIHDLPVQIGFKRINSSQYPARNLSVIAFDNDRITEIVAKRNSLNNSGDFRLSDLVEDFKSKLKSQLPFTVTIERDYERSKEKFKIVNVQNASGDELSASILKLNQQTLSKDTGYWLDSGEFKLSIRA
jgi:hypothetical protein